MATMQEVLRYYMDDFNAHQNVEMSSFSMDTTTFSSDLLTHHATAPPGQKRNAMVLCWENALVPVKWMRQSLGLRPTPKGLHEAKERVLRYPHVLQSLATIEQAMLQLLTTISAWGPVYIVSEESVVFVEAMCYTFFPRLAYCLSSSTTFTNVFVMGAPEAFASTTKKMVWRTGLLQALCRERLYGEAPHLLVDAQIGRFGLIVVSPHQVDAYALAKARDVAPYMIPKSMQTPSAKNMQLPQFALHLQTLTQYIAQAVQAETPFSVSW